MTIRYYFGRNLHLQKKVLTYPFITYNSGICFLITWGLFKKFTNYLQGSSQNLQMPFRDHLKIFSIQRDQLKIAIPRDPLKTSSGVLGTISKLNFRGTISKTENFRDHLKAARSSSGEHLDYRLTLLRSMGSSMSPVCTMSLKPRMPLSDAFWCHVSGPKQPSAMSLSNVCCMSVTYQDKS